MHEASGRVTKAPTGAEYWITRQPLLVNSKYRKEDTFACHRKEFQWSKRILICVTPSALLSSSLLSSLPPCSSWSALVGGGTNEDGLKRLRICNWYAADGPSQPGTLFLMHTSCCFLEHTWENSQSFFIFCYILCCSIHFLCSVVSGEKKLNSCKAKWIGEVQRWR